MNRMMNAAIRRCPYDRTIGLPHLDGWVWLLPQARPTSSPPFDSEPGSPTHPSRETYPCLAGRLPTFEGWNSTVGDAIWVYITDVPQRRINIVSIRPSNPIKAAAADAHDADSCASGNRVEGVKAMVLGVVFIVQAVLSILQ